MRRLAAHDGRMVNPNDGGMLTVFFNASPVIAGGNLPVAAQHMGCAGWVEDEESREGLVVEPNA